LTVATCCDDGFAGLKFEQEPTRRLEGEFKGREGAVCKLDVSEGFHPANEAAGAGLVCGRGGKKVKEGEENGLGLLVWGGGGDGDGG